MPPLSSVEGRGRGGKSKTSLLVGKERGRVKVMLFM